MSNRNALPRYFPALVASQMMAACATSTTSSIPAPPPGLTTNEETKNPAATTNGSVDESGEQHSPKQLVDALHTAFGDHHARAVHAKGVVLTGVFTPDPAGSSLTKARHLQNQPSQVTVRFSDFTGIPDIPDTSASANPRGLAIKFTMPDGATTDIVGHSFNGFPTATSDEFRDLLLAIGASGPSAAKPTAVDLFLSSHPIAKTFLTTQKTPASYATIRYFGVNAFTFVNARAESHHVRYQFVPEGGESLLTAEQLASKGPNYLGEEIKARIVRGPFRFAFYAQVAEAGDKITDPSIAWPDARARVNLGTIEIRELAANSPSEDKALSFSPTNLPDGIVPADPMVSFRARAYPLSVKERQ